MYEADGWMTSIAAANQSGLNADNLRKKFERLLSSGRMERKKIRTMIGNSIREINIYRPRI